MAWSKPQHAKGRIDWAGEVLSRENYSKGPAGLEQLRQYIKAIDIVNNWRAAHSYPLQTIKMSLKRRARRIYAESIVAQRLKRLISIQLKLRLSKDSGEHPTLSQMQDIGGCRAVMDSVDQVRRLEKIFQEASRKNPDRGPQFSKTNDYIAVPKPNGYRSLHLVYRFRSTSIHHACYNGQRIEIQLRSKKQHYWATAVETYSTFTGEALKSNIGSVDWKRFFALVSSAIAISESCPTVPGTPGTLEEIVPELKDLYGRLRVHNVLSGWSVITQATIAPNTPKEIKGAAAYLLILDPEKFSTTLHPFQKEDLANADAHYAKIEKEEPGLQAVLVSVDSLAALRTAYPNYFLDTTAFLAEVDEVIKD